MNFNHKLVIQTGITIICILFIILAFSGGVDTKGREYTNNALDKALITFALARGLNGMISVAQGTEVAIHPAGFGLNFTPGQILDPINDLVEQFSWVMLASSASLGIQRVFLNISSYWVASVVLLILILSYLIILWRNKSEKSETRNIIGRLVVIVVFIRFSVPMAAIGTEVLSHYFLEQEYKESSAKLEKTRDKFGDLNNEAQTQFQQKSEDDSLMDKAKRMLESAASSVDVSKRMDQYKQAAADASRYTVNLIVVFVIQTVLFPLLFLVTIYKFLKGVSQKLTTI